MKKNKPDFLSAISLLNDMYDVYVYVIGRTKIIGVDLSLYFQDRIVMTRSLNELELEKLDKNKRSLIGSVIL